MKIGKRSAIFLDRDGVLNQVVLKNGKPYPPPSAEEVFMLPGVKAALTDLKRQRFILVVVTNQPDVARGTQQRVVVEKIHAMLKTQLPLDDILVCYHAENDGCNCHKPRPGMLLQAADQYDLDLANSFMIGDRWRDIDAGAAVGCRTILIDYHYRDRQPTNTPGLRVSSLKVAADWILSQ